MQEHHSNVFVSIIGGFVGIVAQQCGVLPDYIHVKAQALQVLMAEPILWPIFKTLAMGVGTALITKGSADAYDAGKRYIKKRYCKKQKPNNGN